MKNKKKFNNLIKKFKLLMDLSLLIMLLSKIKNISYCKNSNK
jgi:hypothetical protein